MSRHPYFERTLDQGWHGTLGRREQEPPDAEETVQASRRMYHRDADAYDLLRSEQALNPYGEDLDGALPAEDLEDLGRATYLRGRAGGLHVEPGSAPAPAREPSSSRVGATPSDEQQPRRGHARAA